MTIWGDFSRSFSSLNLFHTEIRQGTHGITCANIILKESTRQTNRQSISGADKTKSLPKSTTPPSRRHARVLATHALSDYKGAARELWDICILGIGLLVCACVGWVINDNNSNTPWRIPQTRRNDLGEKNLGNL